VLECEQKQKHQAWLHDFCVARPVAWSVLALCGHDAQEVHKRLTRVRSKNEGRLPVLHLSANRHGLARGKYKYSVLHPAVTSRRRQKRDVSACTASKTYLHG